MRQLDFLHFSQKMHFSYFLMMSGWHFRGGCGLCSWPLALRKRTIASTDEAGSQVLHNFQILFEILVSEMFQNVWRGPEKGAKSQLEHCKKMIKGAWLRPSDRLDLSIFWDQSSFAIKMFKKKATLTKELQMRSNLVGTELLNILLIKSEFTLCWI